MKPLDQYPTPETDDAWHDGYTFDSEDLTTAYDFACNLERRLAAQTDCLNRIVNTVMTARQMERIAYETLTLTAKP